MKPLDGIKVADLTHALAGPTCTYHLGLLGADVVKVEKVGVGDEFRTFYDVVDESKMTGAFMAANGGKRSLGLDLSKPPGREVLARLVRQSDVLVQNFRPGSMERMGFGWEDCKKLNPKLIYCSISGFGQTGPFKGLVSYDHTVQAMSGLMTLNGSEGDPPTKVGFQIVDFITGYMAHAAIMAALIQRGKTGVGQFIDVSMLDATLVMMAAPLLRSLINQRPHPRIGNRAGRGGAVVALKTKDGELFLGANYQHQFEAFCEVIGDKEFFMNDPRFATHLGREKHEAELAIELEKRLASKTAIEWEELSLKAGCPAGALRTMQEIAKHPQLAARNLLVEASATGLARKIPLINSGYLFEHDGPGLSGHVPEVGEHSVAILGELGYSTAEISKLQSDAII